MAAIGGGGGAIGGSFGTFFGGNGVPVVQPAVVSSTVVNLPTATLARVVQTSAAPSGSQSALTVLSCNGFLPGDGYPPNYYRTNYTSLTDLCTYGCACPGSDSNKAAASCDSTSSPIAPYPVFKQCQSNCTCVSPATVQSGGAPPAQSVAFSNVTSPTFNMTTYFAMLAGQTTSSSCPKGPFPQGDTAAQHRTYPKLFGDLACMPPSLEALTLVSSNFNYHEAQLCLPCPDGYGPDPDCKLQPIPLPGPCNGTTWITNSESGMINTTLIRSPTRNATVNFFGNGTIHVNEGNTTQTILPISSSTASPSATAVIATS